MKILMTSRKQLKITEDSKLYQKENIVDQLIFLLPVKYGEIELSNFTVTCIYLNPQGERKTELLTAEEELYKENFLMYKLPVDTEISKYNGIITLSLSCVWLDSDTMKQYVLKTGTVQIEISPIRDLYEFIPDSTLAVLDQKMLQLDAKIQAVEMIEEQLPSEIPNDLKLEGDHKLHLSIDGNSIGEGVEVLTSVQDVDGTPTDGVIDLDKVPEGEDIYHDEDGIATIDL